MNRIALLAGVSALSIGAAFGQQVTTSPSCANTDASSCTVEPSGATIPGRTESARAADVINVKDPQGSVPGALGTAEYSTGCTISVAGTTVICTGLTLPASATPITPASGWLFYLEGANTSGAPLLGTVVSASLSGSTLTANLSIADVVATPQWQVWSTARNKWSLLSAGSGCSNGEVLTLTGTGTPAQITVDTTTTGAITTWHVSTNGVYNPSPGGTLSIASSTGSCTGAQFKGVPWQAGGRGIFCPDDTAAIETALATGTGKKVYMPAGGYCVNSARGTISLQNLTLYGDGGKSYGWPFFQTGSWFLDFDQTDALFSLNGGVRGEGFGVFDVFQDNTQATPVTSGPIFQFTSNADYRFDHLSLVNAFDCFYSPYNGNPGRVYINNSWFYCARYGSDMLNGAADVFVWGANNYYASGANDGLAITGPAMLDQYTTANGEFFHFDGTNATYTHFDGAVFDHPNMNGLRYAFHLINNAYMYAMDVSALSADGVQTDLQTESGAYLSSASFEIHHANGIDAYDTTQTNPLIYLSGGGSDNILFPDIRVQFTQGNVVKVANNAEYLTFNGGQFFNFARTTNATPTLFYGFDFSAAQSGIINIHGIDFNCNKSALASGITANGIFGDVATNGVTTINGNTFYSCTRALTFQGSAGGQYLITANESHNSNANNSDSSTGSNSVIYGNNNWDTLPNYRAPTISCSSGTATSISGNSQNFSFVAPATATTCTATLTTPLPYVPVTAQAASSTPVITASVTAKSATSITISLSASTGGETISLSAGL